MFYSVCFLLALASYGFSGVQSYTASRFPGGADDYGNSFPHSGGNNYPMFIDDDGNGINNNHNNNHNNNNNNLNKKPSIVFFSGGIVGIMGKLPPPGNNVPDPLPGPLFRGGGQATMKEYEEKLQESLKALNDLEAEVKNRKSSPSKRFLQ